MHDWCHFDFNKLNFKWPDMGRWCNLIREYGNGERELKYDSGALTAIAGMINVMDNVA